MELVIHRTQIPQIKTDKIKDKIFIRRS
ncbi:MAG: hypothetical protein SCARUB_04207, partial [Candidatus Scalindua rubra]